MAAWLATKPGLAGTLLATAVMTIGASGNAQQKLPPADGGKRDFESACAICHGSGGKGDGSYALTHGLSVPDLRSLTARNRGQFPYRRVAAIIDGRHGPVIHGIPGMPIWGDRYLDEAAAKCLATRCNPESAVRARVRALTEYIRRLNSG